MTSYDMSVKNDFPKTQLYKNYFVQLTKFLGFAAPYQDHYCKSHNVNVNTFLQKPGLNLFEEKKILQTNEKEQKYPAQQVCRKKILLTRNHQPNPMCAPLSQVSPLLFISFLLPTTPHYLNAWNRLHRSRLHFR